MQAFALGIAGNLRRHCNHIFVFSPFNWSSQTCMASRFSEKNGGGYGNSVAGSHSSGGTL